MNQAFESAIQFAILAFSIVIHEVSHGTTAYALGDNTAKNEGRLTLNPIPHIDLFGSIILPAIMLLGGGPVFGWAKPVPYNPFNLKNQKYGPALVGAAGPLSNIVVAAFFGVAIRFYEPLGLSPQFIQISASIAALNLILAIFNLVPIPPLDGSKILFAILPEKTASMQEFFEKYGLILLLIFIFFLSGIILPIAAFFFKLITGLEF